ncbi:MAG TPA: type II toxin-antitoxin system PemK/MazF family toxin [Pyrinomonadaceae bacterium]|nr:type II toxin-antitoxin system PemK/MazF family toxin [Pyrinomonadaceae bacterium]
MPPTTVYSFGDVVLVPFPFTDQSGAKKRPAVIVSSDAYNAARPDPVLMAITGQARGVANVGETEVIEWQRAGLLKASFIKPILTTIEKKLVSNKLRRLDQQDRDELQNSLRVILG